MADGKRSARTDVDLEAVERDFRTGQFTSRELGTKYGVSHRTINNWVEKYGWQKDLSADVRQATRTKLAKDAQATVAAERKKRIEAGASPEEVGAVPDAVEVAAEVNKRVILGHRDDLKRTRNVAMSLLGELERAALLDEQAELLAEILAGEGAEPADLSKARATVAKAISLTSRIGGVKALAETITRLQAAERTAFGMDEPDAGKDGGEGGRPMTDAERATRLAALLNKARASREAASD